MLNHLDRATGQILQQRDLERMRTIEQHIASAQAAENLYRNIGFDTRLFGATGTHWLQFQEALERERRRSVGFDLRAFEDARRAHENLDRSLAWAVLEVFARRGWVGVEKLFTDAELSRLWRTLPKKGKKEVDAFICKEFRKRRFERLRRLFRAWWNVPYLNKRKSLVRAALSAHQSGQYALSIPALFPLVDGLTLEIARAAPVAYRRATKIKKLAPIAMKKPATSGGSPYLEEVVLSLYKSFDPGAAGKVPNTCNRNAVLHGRTARYATESNSLRIILLLNVLVRIFLFETRSKKRVA